MQSALEKKRKKFRELYELLFTDYGIKDYRISEKLGYRSVSATLEEARTDQYIVGPECRKCSYGNILEYVYFFNTEEPDITYMEYREDSRVVYNARVYGFVDSMVFSREEIDIDGEIVLKGPRSDYYMPFTPNQSWKQAMHNMQERIRNFNLDDYTPRGFIKNHFNETAKWDEDDEVIYRHFKYNLRRKTGTLIKSQHISRKKIHDWFEILNNRCTVRTGFYPETLSKYQTYLSLFDTDYEDFVIEIFSELPASPSFFKVQDKLILMAYLPGEFLNDTDIQSADNPIIPLLEVELLTKGIIKKKRCAMVGRSKKKDL